MEFQEINQQIIKTLAVRQDIRPAGGYAVSLESLKFRSLSLELPRLRGLAQLLTSVSESQKAGPHFETHFGTFLEFLLGQSR